LAAEVPPPSLTVNGEGIVKVEPDVVLVSLAVVNTAATARGALDANSADAAKLMQAVQAAGVPEKDIATTSFTIDPLYAPPPPNAPQPGTEAPRIVGYRVTNQLRVRVEGVTRSGELLDKVISAGANRVGGLSFDVSNPGPLRDQAMKEAILDARRKAELMAEAAGVTLGRVLSVTTGADAPMPVFETRVAMAPRAVPIAAGERDITATATLVFEITPK
jgi:uncharacterized protein YggE